MIPLSATIFVVWVLVLVLLWLLTPSRKHLIEKVLLSIALTICGALTLWCVAKYDRPILNPEIGGVITQNFNGNALGVDVEAFVKNSGRQSGYADRWQLDLVIDGTTIEGRELFGESLPPHAANELSIFDQEFLPGKPVRGWLFFGFPAVSHDFAAPYFVCNSALMDKVSFRLSVWDSKNKRKWSQTRSLKELGKEACSIVSPEPSPQTEPQNHAKPLDQKKPIGPRQQTHLPIAPSSQFQLGRSNIQSNSGGINVQQGTTGENSPIINSPITVGNLPKKISPADMQNTVRYFMSARAKAKVEIIADQYSGAVPLPDDFYQAMNEGRWEMKESGVHRVMAFYQPGEIFQGAVITIYGEPLGPGEGITVRDSDPIFYIGNVLQALRIPRSLTRSKTQPEGLITINFMGGFPD
jgi:hypothetical protein